MAFDAERAVRWPNPGVRPDEAYTQTSPIDAIIFQLLPDHSTNTWIGLHLVGIIIAIVVAAAWLCAMLPRESQIQARAWRLLLLSPLFALLVSFIGSYDPFTVIAMVLVLFAWRARSRILLVLTGSLLGIAHAEQGFLAFGALTLAYTFGRGLLPEGLAKLGNPAWALLGVGAGRLLLTLYLEWNGVEAGLARAGWLLEPGTVAMALKGSLNFFAISVMATFAGLWVLIVLTLRSKGGLGQVVAWVVPLSLLFAWSFLALDHTRVFVLTSLPIVLVLIVAFLLRYPAGRYGGLLTAAEVGVWVVVPLRVMTSPQGPSWVMDMNALDHWIMWTTQWLHGGW